MFHPRQLTSMPGGVPSLGEGCPDTSLGWWGSSAKDLAGREGEGEGKKAPSQLGEAAKEETTRL